MMGVGMGDAWRAHGFPTISLCHNCTYLSSCFPASRINAQQYCERRRLFLPGPRACKSLAPELVLAHDRGLRPARNSCFNCLCGIDLRPARLERAGSRLRRLRGLRQIRNDGAMGWRTMRWRLLVRLFDVFVLRSHHNWKLNCSYAPAKDRPTYSQTWRNHRNRRNPDFFATVRRQSRVRAPPFEDEGGVASRAGIEVRLQG
jgi:hypothetical protein